LILKKSNIEINLIYILNTNEEKDISIEEQLQIIKKILTTKLQILKYPFQISYLLMNEEEPYKVEIKVGVKGLMIQLTSITNDIDDLPSILKGQKNLAVDVLWEQIKFCIFEGKQNGNA
jgi:hypothetical protein